LSAREPIFNVPGIVVALIVAFAAVHAVRYLLPEGEAAWLTAVLAFVPARLTGLARELPGGNVAAATQFVTHQFVHGDITHLVINAAWLLPFGSLVARRVGPWRFLAFFLVCGIAGALAYAAVADSALSMMVGASGAISGLMGGAFRFLFLALSEGNAEALAGREGHRPRLMSLREALRDRRVFLAVAGWTLLNVVMAWGAASLTDGAYIAWEAHLGGFYMGLLSFGLFDRSPNVHDDAALAE
jgi:membrane associated rhomboid family serine protease